MFRTGHRTDHTAWTEPAPERPAAPEPVAEVAPAAAPVVRPAPRPLAAAAADTTIGQGATFDGTLRFTGTLVIDGTFTGHILAGDALAVGTGATVHADVTCGSIEVSGEVEGSLTATRSVQLTSGARVNAAITTPALRVAEGALFDGAVKMRGASGAARTRGGRAKAPAPPSDDARPAEDPTPTG